MKSDGGSFKLSIVISGVGRKDEKMFEQRCMYVLMLFYTAIDV